jgi:hypothetical protein
MGKRILVQVFVASAILAVACGGRVALLPPSGSGGESGSSGGSGGAGGRVFLNLPDGGLSSLFGDGGILGGILDAPRDSLLGQLICGPEAKLNAKCSSESLGCLLPSLGGACICFGGTYLCPTDTTQGPTACPKGAAAGSHCSSIMSVCIGGGANACICGLGTYTTCF